MNKQTCLCEMRFLRRLSQTENFFFFSFLKTTDDRHFFFVLGQHVHFLNNSFRYPFRVLVKSITLYNGENKINDILFFLLFLPRQAIFIKRNLVRHKVTNIEHPSKLRYSETHRITARCTLITITNKATIIIVI